MVRRMKPGSVVVDLAAEQGGNCELTKADERVTERGITILGPTDLPSRCRCTRARCSRANVEKLINYISRDGNLEFDFSKEIVRGSVVTHDGKVVDEQVAALFCARHPDGRTAGEGRRTMTPEMFFGLYVFMLAAFVGYGVITGVPALLHTPLMAFTNALSGISLVGSIVAPAASTTTSAPCSASSPCSARASTS
jgi:NAD(P) transhydrogenase subunit alpha